jgi:transcriptional regulator with XRE-family HTH domain
LFEANEGDSSLRIEKIFGQILRKHRTINKLSQEKLSQECGLDRSYISLLERGLRQPTLTTILLLSKTLNTTAAAFIHDVEVLLNENIEN